MKRDLNNISYSLLHAHSEYSNIKVIDSINRFDRMVDYAWDLNLSGLAMTEHDCLSGTLYALDVYRDKLKNEWSKNYPDEEFTTYEEASKRFNFKVILGNEIYLSEEGCNRQMQEEQEVHFWHLILLAKDSEGYLQLKKLSSAAWKRSWVKGILRTPTYSSDLLNIVNGGHLICSTACLGGIAPYYWRNYILNKGSNNDDEAQYFLDKLDNHLSAMQDLFGKDNFYIELQPNEEGSEQNEYNKFMYQRYWNKYPFIFTTDAHYLKADQRQLHKAFLNSKSSKDREVDDFYKYTYIMDIDEIKSLMSYIPEEDLNIMARNTQKITDMCQFYELEQKPKLATVQYEYWDKYENDLQIFNEVDESTYPNFYYFLHTDNKPDNYLARLIAHGYIEKYKTSWEDDIYFSRLEEELWTLKQVGEKIEQPMSDYFITMSKIINICWNEADSLIGPSRGSAGAMLINYLLGITQMNPIEMDLPFVWRFLHPSRPDLPDIDFDTESNKRSKVFNAVKSYFQSIGGDVINVCTFGTEGTKSAIKTAGRGLDIDENVIAYITSMIPNERGFDWSLNDCYYGNGNDRKPIKAFIEQMQEYPDLWELASNIEGLITRLGVHASGVVCVNDDFNNYCSYMKTNHGQLVTAFDLHKLDRCGMVKYDFLTVSALDRIRQCMNYMLEDGTMKWQGSLYDTYNKYLSPQVLDYDNEEMWEMASNGAISSLFQFDTTVGGQSIKKIQPRSLKQLAIANSVMRLMSDGEQPIDIYVKQKMVPQLWYDDMYNCGLTDEEIKVLEKYLKDKNGVADSQEVVMQLSMDPKISGFDMKDANKLRKIIAKKKFDEIDKMHDYYFECGRKLCNSDNILNYVWEKQFRLSFGYSFSSLHTTGYSLIAIQEMNLAYHYPIVYWNCACLSVDSSAISENDFYNLIDNNIIDIDDDEDEDDKKTINKMDYSKIASALNNFKRICTIHLPDINKSKLSFTPDVESNSILYGLKGICKITDPVIEEIMNNRPFSSLEDFLNKVTKKVVTKDKVINLIKCGAFDNIEHKSRKEILENFIWKTCDPKNRLTMQNAATLISYDMFPHDQSYDYSCNVYELTKELRKNRDKCKIWYCIDKLDIPENKVDIWKQIFKDSNIEFYDMAVEVIDNDSGQIINELRTVINSDKWDNFYQKKMILLSTYVKTYQKEMLTDLNNKLFNDEFDKYCKGDILKWELDSLNFYFTDHPLKNIQYDILANNNYNTTIPNLVNVDDIVEGAQDGEFYIKGKTIPKMKIYTLAGTVLDRDKVKGIVTVQCPSGILTLKLYKELYSIFVQVVDGQDSFFEKGVHLLISGIKRGSTFIPKVYKNMKIQSISKINLDKDNHLISLEDKK